MKRTLVGGKILEPYDVVRDVTWFYASRGHFELIHYVGLAPIHLKIPTRLLRAALADIDKGAKR